MTSAPISHEMPPVKALSIRQPWAWLICAGYKDVENRTWPTNFQGRVYVHAGKQRDTGYSDFLYRLFDADVPHHIWEMGPGEFGAIIGEVDITGCMRKNYVKVEAEHHHAPSMGDQQRELEYLKERYPVYFSPWFTGPYGFTLANPKLYDKPIPCKGRLVFFTPQLPMPTPDTH